MNEKEQLKHDASDTSQLDKSIKAIGKINDAFRTATEAMQKFMDAMRPIPKYPPGTHEIPLATIGCSDAPEMFMGCPPCASITHLPTQSLVIAKHDPDKVKSWIERLRVKHEHLLIDDMDNISREISFAFSYNKADMNGDVILPGALKNFNTQKWDAVYLDHEGNELYRVPCTFEYAQPNFYDAIDAVTAQLHTLKFTPSFMIVADPLYKQFIVARDNKRTAMRMMKVKRERINQFIGTCNGRVLKTKHHFKHKLTSKQLMNHLKTTYVRIEPRY